jgi:hypothetical protein
MGNKEVDNRDDAKAIAGSDASSEEMTPAEALSNWYVRSAQLIQYNTAIPLSFAP